MGRIIRPGNLTRRIDPKIPVVKQIDPEFGAKHNEKKIARNTGNDPLANVWNPVWPRGVIKY